MRAVLAAIGGALALALGFLLYYAVKVRNLRAAVPPAGAVTVVNRGVGTGRFGPNDSVSSTVNAAVSSGSSFGARQVGQIGASVGGAIGGATPLGPLGAYVGSQAGASAGRVYAHADNIVSGNGTTRDYVGVVLPFGNVDIPFVGKSVNDVITAPIDFIGDLF